MLIRPIPTAATGHDSGCESPHNDLPRGNALGVMKHEFALTPDDANVVYHALRYYTSELLDSYIVDDESETLNEAIQSRELADRLQLWLVANHQSLVREES